MADPAKINRPLTREYVQQALERIRPHIHLTPVIQCATLDGLASAPQARETIAADRAEAAATSAPAEHDDVSSSGAANGGDAPSSPSAASDGAAAKPAEPNMKLFFKCENQQKIGAFKARGAFHALSRLTDGQLENGVITHSSGNHAQALALAAATRKIPAHIVMPHISTPSKIAAVQAYAPHCVHVHFSGSTDPERVAATETIQRATGALFVPPYDHPDIMLGQGTVALEFEAQVKELLAGERDGERAREGYGWRARAAARARARPGSEGLDAVVAPCGGGGLLSGVAMALAGTGTHVFGAEPLFEGADDCRRGLAARPPARVERVATLTVADGLRTPVGAYPWQIISDRRKVRGVYAVTESQIKRAMRLLLERAKTVVEPSGAVALAVALYNEEFRRLVEREAGPDGWNVGIVLSGGNTTVEAIAALFSEDEEATGSREAGTVGQNGEPVAENVAG